MCVTAHDLGSGEDEAGEDEASQIVSPLVKMDVGQEEGQDKAALKKSAFQSMSESGERAEGRASALLDPLAALQKQVEYLVMREQQREKDAGSMQRAEAKMLELHDQMARVHEVCVAALHLALTMVAACSCHILVCCPMYVQCDKADVAVFAGRTLWTCFPRSRRSFPAKRSLENARERPTRALKLLCTINLKSSPQCSPTPTRAGHRRAGAGVVVWGLGAPGKRTLRR